MSATTQHKWAVTGQEEHPTLDENGKPTTEHHVKFKTASGHESHVTMPDHSYSAQNVAAAIEHKATEIEKVHSLTSESRPTGPGEPA